MKHVGEIILAYVHRLDDRPLPSVRASGGRRLTEQDPRALANELVRNREFERAWRVLAGLIDQHPNDAYLWRRMGKASRDAGYVAQAVRCYDRALQLEPDEGWGIVGRAEALAEIFEVSCEELLDAIEQLRALRAGAVPGSVVLRVTGMLLRALERRSGHPVPGQLAGVVRQHAAALA